MRTLTLALIATLTLSSGLSGCCSRGPSPEAKDEDKDEAEGELKRPKAVLTGVDGQSVSVRDVEVSLLGSCPVKHGPTELLFLNDEDSDDHVVYPMDEITSIELLETKDKTLRFLYPVKLTLESGRVSNLLLFRFKEMTGRTLDEGGPFRRTLPTLSRIDFLNDASEN